MAKDTSTRFPFISLEKAIVRAEQLYAADPRGNSMLVLTAFEAWSYSPKSSGGQQTVAALRMYGLIDVEGMNEDRRILLSSDALNYFRDEREEEKLKYLQKFALSPALVASIWEIWGTSPPADSVARSHLKLDRGMNEQSARTFLALYKENVSFASLDSLESGPANNGDEVPDLSEEGGGANEGTVPSPGNPLPNLLSGERELASGMLSKDATFRVIVSGSVGVKEIEVLIKKLEIDKEIISDDGQWD